ncbi:MAG TPA: hypothetical protein VEN29_00895 [Casimicrobiaceae bacterium]|nr:hypothetical protein [Casimicrobiaceae bacterium]
MFGSPFAFCPVCKEYVLLDQTHRECAHQHQCTGVPPCPLERFFSGIEFREERKVAKKDGRTPRR